MVEIHNQTNQQTPHKKLPRPAEAGSDQGKRPPEAISSVDRAFQLWVSGVTPPPSAVFTTWPGWVT